MKFKRKLTNSIMSAFVVIIISGYSSCQKLETSDIHKETPLLEQKDISLNIDDMAEGLHFTNSVSRSGSNSPDNDYDPNDVKPTTEAHSGYVPSKKCKLDTECPKTWMHGRKIPGAIKYQWGKGKKSLKITLRLTTVDGKPAKGNDEGDPGKTDVTDACGIHTVEYKINGNTNSKLLSEDFDNIKVYECPIVVNHYITVEIPVPEKPLNPLIENKEEINIDIISIDCAGNKGLMPIKIMLMRDFKGTLKSDYMGTLGPGESECRG